MQKNIIKPIILLSINFLFLITVLARADEKYYNLVELINNSNVVIKGKVVEINSYERVKGRIYSDIKFYVTKILKGKLVENQEIILTYYGGTIQE